ncbi:MAG TPA: DUF58 domain-containing protein [Bacteroidales bacterium]|nr:DUF58 domain-containing protein [Bacteroidales bacterium]
MDTSNLIKKVRKIEIKTRGLTNQVFAGYYHSAFKGRGIAFSEVREYQYGDDIRSIDWNVTARLNHPFVKVFEEERELTVMLLIDMSGSNQFGALGRNKAEIIAEISGVLAFSALANNDKVGVIFFSDVVEKFIPPKKGSRHILRIIREIITFVPTSKGTDLSVPLKYLQHIIKKKSISFLISDFNQHTFESALNIANKKHDMVCIRVFDNREMAIPPMGILKFSDAETGEVFWIDTSSERVQEKIRSWNLQHEAKLKRIFAKAGVDVATIPTHTDFVRPLINLFKSRSLQ